MVTIEDLKKQLLRETDDQRKPVFTSRRLPNGKRILELANMSLPERKLRSNQMPKVLAKQALLTEKELEDHNWIEANDNEVYYVEAPGIGPYGIFCKVSYKRLCELGLGERFAAVRLKLLKPDLQKSWETFLGAHYKKEYKTTYEVGLSHQPSYGPSTLQMGRLSKSHMKLCIEIHNEILAITSEAARKTFADLGQGEHGRD